MSLLDLPTTLRSVNPVTDETIAEFPVHTTEDVADVVERARLVSAWWSGRTSAQREKHLLRWAALLARRADDLVDLLHHEHGKPREEGYLELVPSLEQIRWSARNAGKVLKPRTVSPGLLMANHHASVEYRPYGVVGVIGPWNYPVFTPAGSIGYALAAGNTVVFKPSEYTPAVGQYLVDAFAESNPDVPAGVLSIVTGRGETGAALCRSGVDKIAFTGSQETGRRVLAACAEDLVPVLLECGGKDAMIVAEDANVTAAAKAAVWGAFSNSGQTCVGIEQVYVVETVRDRFLADVRQRLQDVRPGSTDNAPYGPMTMPGQVDVVRRHVDDALARGGTALVGGRESVRDPFIEPVVIVDPPDDCSAVTEETFGPTLTVRTVQDVDEALRLANSRNFGLGASVFSRRRGTAIAHDITAGMVAINCALAFVGIPALPFGGVGQSGFGRIHGADGLREFAVTKSYARQRFTVPGMDTVTLNRSAVTMRMIKLVIRLRHGRA